MGDIKVPSLIEVPLKKFLCLLLTFGIAQAMAQLEEPVYAGKPESYWLNFLMASNISNIGAWRDLGTNSQAILQKAIQTSEGPHAATIRSNAAFFLSQWQDPKILLPLATNSPFPEVRASALCGLIFVNERSVTEVMVEALSDPNTEIRRAAVSGLGLSAREPVAEEMNALVRCLQDSDAGVRLTAATILQNFWPASQSSAIEAAAAEIKRAVTNQDPEISEPATKAAREHQTGEILDVYAHEIALRKSRLDGKEWHLTLNVVDEEDHAISDADVSVTYYVPAKNGEDPWSSAEEIKGATDAEGKFTASHKDTSWEIGLSAKKASFYETRGGHEFYFPGQLPAEKMASNRNPVITLRLKKIIHQIPMYVNRVDIAHQKHPAFDKPVGFDLIIGDWVAPYGKGTNTHILFTWHTDYDTNTVSNLGKYRNRGWDERMTISFPNRGDGIQEFDIPGDRNGDKGADGSELRSAQQAPENGYAPTLVKISGWHPNRPSTNNYDHLHKNYYFRVQTILDEKGDIKSTHYGKIYGDFESAFSTYLNPEPNSRDLEFDMKRSLGPNGINWYIRY